MPPLAGFWLAGEQANSLLDLARENIITLSYFTSHEIASKKKSQITKKKVGGEVFSAEYFDYQQQNSAKNGC